VGTNYVAAAVSLNPNVQTVPPNSTTAEFPLIQTLPHLNTAFSLYLRQSFIKNSRLDFDAFLPYFGDAWLSYLVDTYDLRPGHVFLKEPSVNHLDKFFLMLPRAKLVILLRDGRDNVSSSVRASRDHRLWRSASQNARRRVSQLLLRDFIAHSRGWASAVRSFKAFERQISGSPRVRSVLVLKYEDLYHHPVDYGRRLMEFIGVPYDDAILKQVAEANVVGSSFYSTDQLENARKPNWVPTPKSASFNPVGRWKSWTPLEKMVFKRIAGKELIDLEYASDMNW
jgi:hypothetical protein